MDVKFDYTPEDLKAFQQIDYAQSESAQQFTVPENLKAPGVSAHDAGMFTARTEQGVGLPDIRDSREQGHPNADSHAGNVEAKSVWKTIKRNPSGRFIVMLDRGKYLGSSMQVVNVSRMAAHRYVTKEAAEIALMEFAGAFCDGNIPPRSKVVCLKPR